MNTKYHRIRINIQNPPPSILVAYQRYAIFDRKTQHNPCIVLFYSRGTPSVMV